jgi:hypothetical protein
MAATINHRDRAAPDQQPIPFCEPQRLEQRYEPAPRACSFGQVRAQSITAGFRLEVLLVFAEPLPA